MRETKTVRPPPKTKKPSEQKKMSRVMPREEKETKQQRDVEPVHYTYTAGKKKRGRRSAGRADESRAIARKQQERETIPRQQV